jgi:hypothetical protein
MGVAYGTTGTTVCVGNDSRLSDPRTPVAHKTSHEPGGADALAVDAAAATGSLRTLGTTSTSACAGNDSRLSDARTPVAHNQAWTTITATPTTISGYGLTDAASTGANTLTGAQLIRAAATQDAIEILGRAGGTSSYRATITPFALSASRTWSLPDRTDTFAGLKSNTFTEAQIIGTDPGGTAILRVGGSARIGDKLVVDNDLYIGNSSSSSGVIFRLDGYSDRLYVVAAPSAIAGSSIAFRTGVAGGAETDRVTINDNGSFVLGTDPGGSELLRVGGSVKASSVVVTSTTEATDKDTGSIVTEGGIASEKTQFSQTGHNVANKFRMHYDSATGEYGPQFKLTNRTGSNTVKGTIVRASTANDMAFETEAADEDEPIGIVYEGGVADGSDAWVWGSGAVAQVLLVNSTAATRGYWASVGSAAGRADMTNADPIVANHWREIGHCLESKTAGTNVLARALIHFN